MAARKPKAQLRASAPRLFDPQQHELRPCDSPGLGREARRRFTSSERRTRREETRRTMQQLREWGTELGRMFGLRYTTLDAEREGVYGHYGICYEDGVIKIRLRHARTGRLLKESSLVDTLCHELAHLRHLDHSDRFKGLYLEILDAARELGYYRPGPAEELGPTQLDLFGGGCGTTPRHG